MKEVVLEAEVRDVNTKGTLNNFRSKGFIPSIIYGRKKKNIPLIVNRKSFIKALHTEMGEHVLITLKIKGTKENNTVIIKDMYIDPILREVKHIDFHRVSLTEKIEVNIPFELQNVEKSVGVKKGGIAELIMHEVAIKCLPAQMPKSILVDVMSKDIGDSVLIKELNIGAGLEVLVAEDSVVANIVAPKIVEEEKTEVAAEPEVISKGKKEEEEKEKEKK